MDQKSEIFFDSDRKQIQKKNSAPACSGIVSRGFEPPPERALLMILSEFKINPRSLTPVKLFVKLIGKQWGYEMIWYYYGSILELIHLSRD